MSGKPSSSVPMTMSARLIEAVPQRKRNDGSIASAMDSLVRMEDEIRRLGEYLKVNFLGAHREGEPIVDTAIRLLEQLKRLRDRGNGDMVVLAEERATLERRLRLHIARVRDAE